MLLIIKILLEILTFLEGRMLNVGGFIHICINTHIHTGAYIKAQEILFHGEMQKDLYNGHCFLSPNVKSETDLAKYRAVCLSSPACCILCPASALQFPYCLQNRYSGEHAVNSAKVRTPLSRAQGKAITEAKA